MADIADVELALVAQVSAALGMPDGYLDGDYAASGLTSLTTKIYRGWPVSNQLDVDLKAGKAHVAVYAISGQTRITTRFPNEWQPLPRIPCAISVTVSNGSATFDGTPTSGQFVGLRIGPEVSGSVFTYIVQPSDTLASICAALATLVPSGTSSGATVTAPDLTEARCEMSQTTYQEVQRQVQGFRIGTWCPSPLARDATAGAIKQQLAGLLDQWGRNTDFIPLRDGTVGWMKPHADYIDDAPQKAHLWRRDVCMQVEYATIISKTVPVMLWGVGTVNNVPFTDTEIAIADLVDDRGFPIVG